MPGERDFVTLQSPVAIGDLALKNRIVMAPMVTRTATAEGAVTDRTIAHYALRARGGMGMIVVEAVLIDTSHGPLAGHLALDDDRFIPGLLDLTEAVHRAGPRVAVQVLYPHLFRFPPTGEVCQAGQRRCALYHRSRATAGR